MSSYSCASSRDSSQISRRSTMSATARLQRAMEVHMALMATTTANHETAEDRRANSPNSAVIPAGEPVDFEPSAPVSALADQLQALWQREKDHPRIDPSNPAGNSENVMQASLEKIGSREKDKLLLHLLEQQDALRAQRSEVAVLGEKIAAQLLHQLHELRQNYRGQIQDLEAQLHQALHCNPQVVALQTRVEELEESNREHEQKLRFAVQKLQRSRKREKELKMMNDPLWD